MSLSCSCDDYDNEPGMVIWYGLRNYTLAPVGRRSRCCSCNEIIKAGTLRCEAPRFRVPEYDVEIKIYGEDGEIDIASKWMCERCADLYFSLKELGFCEQPWEDQRNLVAEYAELKAYERQRSGKG